ncbi:MAG: hypothetical protein JST92_02545 [Deltaproteobacteria bacterium]|nr:hypothetical protein [Deltaproteobacteria bacterium]
MPKYSALARVHPETDARPGGIIDAAISSKFLKRGDVLIKFAGTEASTTEKVIMGGEKAVRFLSGLFHKEIRKGDAKSFHVALYLGNGRTAEAHGGNLKTAHVGLRSIDDHAGFLFRVYRCTDVKLAEEAALVGERWATTDRMKYAVPVAVPFERANFGPHAREEALVFGKAADTQGGPPSFSKMFCSQFVIAAYQAAVVARQLKKSPKLAAKEVQMTAGLDLHATNASPLAFHSKLVAHTSLWAAQGEVLVRPQHDVNALNAAAEHPGPNVGKDVDQLGNPTAKRWAEGEWRYARNPWDLRAVDGRVYIASGNANNPPPAANAGPVDVWVYDPARKDDPHTQGFAIEYVVNDEGIEKFCLLSDGLWIPGEDSHLIGRNDGKVTGESWVDALKRKFKTAESVPADWALGNAYHKRAGGWEQLRTIRNAIHVYDLVEFDKQLFAAISTVAGGMVSRSTDRGLTWKNALTKPLPWGRTRTLFTLEDFGQQRLFGSTNGAAIYRWEPAHDDFSPVPVDFFPGVTNEDDRKETFAARALNYRNQVVYIGARKIIDHDWSPLGLFAAQKVNQARGVPLPGGALPRAILTSSDGLTLYVLASLQLDPETTHVAVFATTDWQLLKWTELFWFEAGTFARSFALHKGDFYLGLGSDPERLHDDTGLLLRVPKAAYSR